MISFEQKELFDAKEIDEINPLERLSAESFEPAKFIQQHAGNEFAYSGEYEWYEIETQFTGKMLKAAPEIISEDSALIRLDFWKFEEYVGKATAHKDIVYPGLSVTSHSTARESIGELSKNMSAVDSESTEDFARMMLSMRGILDVRMNNGARKLSDLLSYYVSKNLPEVRPWAVAVSNDKNQAPIAAQIVGFQFSNLFEGLPVIEPVVLSFNGKQKGLLPFGFHLDEEDWLKYEAAPED